MDGTIPIARVKKQKPKITPTYPMSGSIHIVYKVDIAQ
jgi:hypothetical protein